MALTDDGILSLKDIAVEFTGDGDGVHNLSDFYNNDLSVDNASTVLSEWLRVGISTTGYRIFDPYLSDWNNSGARGDITCVGNVGHYDIILAPSDPVPPGEDVSEYLGYVDNRFDNYDLEVILGSAGNDDDAIGVVAIGEVDPVTSNNTRFLLVERNMGYGADSPGDLLKLIYVDSELNKHVELVSAGAAEGLTYETAANGGWGSHGEVRVLVQRRGDRILVRTSNGPTRAWNPYATLTYDLNDLEVDADDATIPNLIGGRRAYGYFTRSQAGAYITFIHSPSRVPYGVSSDGTPPPELSDDLPEWLRLSDFYGYGKMPTYILDAPNDFDASEQSGPLQLMDLFDAKYGIAITESIEGYKGSVITKTFLPSGNYIINIKPSAANPTIWCKYGGSGAHGLEFDFSGMDIADAVSNFDTRKVKVHITVEGDVVGRGGAGGGSCGYKHTGKRTLQERQAWDRSFSNRSYIYDISPTYPNTTPGKAQDGGHGLVLDGSMGYNQTTDSFKITLDISKARLFAGAGGGNSAYSLNYDRITRLGSSGQLVSHPYNDRQWVTISGAGGQGGESALGIPRGSSYAAYHIAPSTSQVLKPYVYTSTAARTNGYIGTSCAETYSVKYRANHPQPPYFWSVIASQAWSYTNGWDWNVAAHVGMHGGKVNADGTATGGVGLSSYNENTIPSNYDTRYSLDVRNVSRGSSHGNSPPSGVSDPGEKFFIDGNRVDIPDSVYVIIE